MASPAQVSLAAGFLDAVERSGVVPAEVVAKLRATASDTTDPRDLARQLLRDGKLTKWQANQLLRGPCQLMLGKYRLLELLGSGEMGKSYLAEHETLARRVTLKLLARRITSQPEVLRQFLDDATKLAAVEHPNLSHVYDVNHDGDRYYMVMEYVEGDDLEKLVTASGPLAPATAIDHALQAIDGLAAAGANNIVHGDLKPSNLLRDAKGCIRVLDLGLSKLAAATPTAGVDESSQMASLRASSFHAPEQRERRGAIDSRADIYSLGSCLFFILTGSAPPLEVTSEAAIDEARAGVPAAIKTALLKLLATSPEGRPQTLAEAKTLLAQVQNGLSKPEAAAAKPAAKPTQGGASKPPASVVSKPAAKPPAGTNSGAMPAVANSAAKGAPPRKPPVARPITSTAEKPSVRSEKPRFAMGPPATEAAAPSGASDSAGGSSAWDNLGASGSSASELPALNFGSSPAATPSPSSTPAAASAPPARKPPAKRASAATDAANATSDTSETKVEPAAKSKMPLIIGASIGGGVLVIGGAIAVVLAIMFSSSGEPTQLAENTDKAAASASEEPSEEGSTEATSENNPAEENPSSEENPTVEENPAIAVAEAAPAAEVAPAPVDVAAVDPASSETSGTPADPATEAPTEPATPAPETAVAEAAPTPEPAPAAPAPAPAPAAPAVKPFEGFAKTVALPPVDAKASAPVVLGPCRVAPNALVIASLSGGEGAHKGKQKFVMQNANGGTAERDWEISLAPIEGEGPSTIVATMSVKENNVVFQWAEAAVKEDTAQYLCNCAIKFAAGPDTHFVSLREVITGESLATNFDKASATTKWMIPLPPDTKKLMVAITKVEGGGAKHRMEKPALEAMKDFDFLWLGLTEDATPLALKLDTVMTGTRLTVTAMPHFKLEGMQKPDRLLKTSLSKLEQQITGARMQVNQQQMMIDQNRSLNPQAKEQQKAALLQFSEANEKANSQFAQLKQVFDGLQNGGQIHFRVYYAAEDTEITILETVAGEATGPVEGKKPANARGAAREAGDEPIPLNLGE